MSHDDALLSRVASLLSLSLEGELSEEQFASLEHLLETEPRAREYYYRLLSIHAMIQEAESILALQDDVREIPFGLEVWKALSIEEKTAPAVPVVQEEKPRKVVSKIQYERAPRRVSRFSLFLLVFSSAAMLFFALLLHFAPPPPVEAATMTGGVGAVFAGKETFSVGNRLVCGEPVWLREGVLEVTFDYGAKVIVEAPAEFHLNSAESIALRSGRLFASVPGQSKGFIVETPSSRVIDLGTEFGIRVDCDGASDIHMIRGRASVIPGTIGQTTGESRILNTHEAKRVDRNGRVNNIPLRTTDFVRAVNTQRRTLWRGQGKLYLADIVSGGSGFESRSRRTVGINPGTGRLVEKANEEIVGGARAAGYMPVPELPFVDGVFVPDGGEGPVTVSSAGHTYDQFGDTGGVYYIPINSNSTTYVNYLQSMALVEMSLKGYPTEESSLLCLHANAGITFDLEAIRDQIPARITRFHSAYGISWNRDARASIASDFYVLVDGEPRMVSRGVSEADGSQTVSIPLKETDRFLTLACAEGEMNSGDWSLFVNPILELE